jgi:sterol desaturase/sphingolipid hydroxylase (fatty acid hydroxylase superfamily)
MINWALVQFSVFVATFGVLLAAERFWPRRVAAVETVPRWSANLGFTLANTAASQILRFVSSGIAVVLAAHADIKGYGLFAASEAPWWLAVPLSMAALDLTLYTYHLACHKFSWLWSFHRVHHLDLEVDATTAFRAHPFEFVSSQLLKAGAIYALGAPIAAVIAYEITLNVFAMFSHSNLRLSERLDRIARVLVVTPDMHRIHHSSYQPETDSNYGVVTPLWDRLFGTYLEAPRDGQLGMQLGLEEVRDGRTHNLLWLIICPFLSFKPGKRAQVPATAVTTSLRTPA